MRVKRGGEEQPSPPPLRHRIPQRGSRTSVSTVGPPGGWAAPPGLEGGAVVATVSPSAQGAWEGEGQRRQRVSSRAHEDQDGRRADGGPGNEARCGCDLGRARRVYSAAKGLEG